MTTTSPKLLARLERPYALVGAIAAALIALFVVLAYYGATGFGLFTSASAIFALGTIVLVMAFGIGYVLFTLRASLRDMRSTGNDIEARIVRLEGHSALIVKAALASAVLVPAVTLVAPQWTPLPERQGAHAARARAAPAIEIEGIGTVFAARLKEAGVSTVGGVKAADPAVVASLVKVNVETFRQWQSMADLIEVDQVGKQYSELLVRSGVLSVDSLAAMDARTLLTLVEETQASKKDGSERLVSIQGTRVTMERVREWIAAARRIA